MAAIKARSVLANVFFRVASPATLASLIADVANMDGAPPHPESETAMLRDDAMQVLIANVGEAEAYKLIDAAAGVPHLSPVEMLDRALDRCGRGWGGDPMASLVALELEEAGFDAATFEAVNLCDGVVVATPLVG